MRQVLLAVALLASPAAVMAEGLSYTYVDARYFSTDADATSVNQSGGELSGSLALGELFYVLAEGSFGETERFSSGSTSGKFQTISASGRLGVHHELAPTLDVIANVGALYGEVKGKGGFSGSDDDVGYVVEGGLRLALVPSVEVGASYTYQDIFSDTSGSMTGDLQYHFDEHFSAVASATFASSTDVFTVGARYRF